MDSAVVEACLAIRTISEAPHGEAGNTGSSKAEPLYALGGAEHRRNAYTLYVSRSRSGIAFRSSVFRFRKAERCPQ